jgi:hypothetical protein
MKRRYLAGLLMLAAVAPLAGKTVTLAWDNSYTDSVGFVVQCRTNARSAWVEVGRVTNQFIFTRVTTNACEFYRVGAFWP